MPTSYRSLQSTSGTCRPFLQVDSFSFDSRLRVGPNESTREETQKLISQLFTLQFNQQYTLQFFAGANSRAGQHEIPEPATVLMFVSGLGAMVGFVKKTTGEHG
jgi:hypothetical protein